jgi:hypothetical protein
LNTPAWSATRDPSGVLPTVINDDPADWDIGGRLESHDGLEVHEWTFDDRILHASFDPDGAGPADTRLFAGVCPYAPTRARGVMRFNGTGGETGCAPDASAISTVLVGRPVGACGYTPAGYPYRSPPMLVRRRRDRLRLGQRARVGDGRAVGSDLRPDPQSSRRYGGGGGRTRAS